MIESLTGISIRSPFFSGNPLFEFFPLHNKPTKRYRAALLYGPNGSGKSTIAQGFREYVEATSPRTVDILPLCGNIPCGPSPATPSEKISIFDETYIDRSVKIQASGLDTIVLFGEQVQLEQQIRTITQDIEQKSIQLQQQENDIKKYALISDVNSPQYWIATITRMLQASGGWAENAGIKIKHNRTSARVNETEIERLGRLQPKKNESETQIDFDQTFSVYSSIDSASQPVAISIKAIDFDGNIEVLATELLSTSIQRPTLSQRESDLLNTFGMKVISGVKGFLIDSAHTTCPTCLQPISSEYRTDMIERIEKILNRDIEDFRCKLRILLLNEIPANSYQMYSSIDAKTYEQVVEQISVLNAAILEHNNAIQTKIDDPFGIMFYDKTIDVSGKFHNLNQALSQLEKTRISYNEVIASKKRTETELLRLNDDLAHYSIQDAYVSLCKQRDAKRKATEALNTLEQQIRSLKDQLQQLDAQRKNFQIAADQINQSLEYIFYSKDRLELELGADQLYHLKSYGQPVRPEKISCGERNALALCYFFTEIARESDAHSLYTSEFLLVIDDPISSFDMENRVGVLSYLRYKLNQVLCSCATTKVLIMTHDISVLFDMEKALEEIAKNCTSMGISSEFLLFQLKDKQLFRFEYQRHNEYTALLQRIYAYARNPTPDQNYVIGNIMRRVLEAFSSFSFKKGIEDISLNDDILGLLPDERSRQYFQNSMYRLVLNTESHFKEAIQGAPEISFFSHLTTTEKQRTAKDILCFMYKLNGQHILAHLPDAKNDLDTWWANISSSSTSQ